MSPSQTRPQTAPVERLQVPVHLDFRLEGADLDFDEIRDIDIGHVIDLEVPSSVIAVDICINGVSVGTGELVTLDGNLAVRVESIADHG